MEASRIELPTRTTMPPRMSGSTVGGQLDLAAGLLGDAVADLLDGALVELDRGGDLRPGRSLFSSSHSSSNSRRMRKIDRHAVVLDQQLEEVDERSASAPETALSQPVLLLLRWRSRARRRTPAARGRRRARRRTRRAARGRRRACPAPARPRTASGRRRRRSPPWLASAPRRPGRRSRARRAPPRRAASGRRRSSVLRVTFSVASTVRSATSARISWIARRVSASMSRRVCSIISSRLRARLGERLGLVRPRPSLRARATMSSAWPRAPRRGARGTRASSSSASLLGALGGVDRVLDRLLALVERLGDAREGDLPEDEQRDAEDDQRPDHQPDAGLTRKLPPLVFGCDDSEVSSRS